MAYVYIHIRKTDNQPFYIGIGKDKYLHRAFDAHPNRRNTHWINTVLKHDYRVKILYNDIDYEEAIFLEKELISFFGRMDMKTGILCNRTDGGYGTVNMKYSLDYRKKLSIAAKKKILSEEQKAKLRAYRRGRHNSKEAREKISIANKGKKKPDGFSEHLSEIRKGENNPMFGKSYAKHPNYLGMVYAYRNGELLNSYLSTRDCSEKMNIPISQINRVIKGDRKSYHGMTFERRKNL